MHWSYSEAECRLWYESKCKEWDWGLIAEDGGTPIGFIAVAAVHLDQLFVDPDCQRRGIGSYLLKQALGRVPAVATLNVFEQNTLARAFYEKHGFREVRRFLNEQERSVELVYRRDLRPDCSAAIRGPAAPAALRHPRAAPS